MYGTEKKSDVLLFCGYKKNSAVFSLRDLLLIALLVLCKLSLKHEGGTQAETLLLMNVVLAVRQHLTQQSIRQE